MTFLITTFYISLAGVIGTLLMKMYQEWVDRDLFFHCITRRLDYSLRQKVHDWKITLRTRRAVVKSKINVFMQVTVKMWIAHVWHASSVQYTAIRNYVKGRQILRRRGAVSFYFKDIAKFKQHLSARHEIK
ncbi:MAG: hypothetical protein WC757_01490 [Candidatus Paceibacterota bacterium]|jgi:hypothetical protein